MLAIYNSNQLAIADLAGAIVTSHNGTLGESTDTLLYIKNDDVNVYYTSILVQVQDSYDSDDTKGPQGSGWGVKLSKGSRRPTSSEWEAITWDNQISLDNVGTSEAPNTTTYFPFWLRVVVPGNTPSQIKSEMMLVVSAAEKL